MIRFVWWGIRRSPLPFVGMVAGIAAVVGVSGLLTGTVETNRAQVTGSLQAAFRPAYDILVRPAGDATSLERSQGLVRDNFLGDLYSGITVRQLHAVEQIPGLQVAPVENVGYVIVPVPFLLPFRAPDSGPPEQLFRVSASVDLDGRRYPMGSEYVYVSRTDRFVTHLTSALTVSQLVPGHPPETVCGLHSTPPVSPLTIQSPFQLGMLDGGVICFSEVTPTAGSVPGNTVEIPMTVDFPMLLTAIDPSAESSLFGLGRAVVRGRMLGEEEGASTVEGTDLGTVVEVPVLASTTTFLRESLVTATSLVDSSNGSALPRRLGSSDVLSWAASLPSGFTVSTADPVSAIYSNFLQQAFSGGSGIASIPVPQYWVPTAPQMRSAGRYMVDVSPTSNPISIWRTAPGWQSGGESFVGGHELGYVAAPPENDGTAYKRITVRDLRWSGLYGQDEQPVSVLDVVGEFDPSRLPGFSPLSKVPLETFSPPFAHAANPSSAKLLGSDTLGPTMNLAGYVAQPPLLLTTLAAAQALLATSRYSGTIRADKAPIAALLVRLWGTLGVGAATRARLEATARAIQQATGLQVDVMDGSSPTPVSVDLEHGGPQGQDLQLTEGWTRKGVTYELVAALDQKSLWLLGLMISSGILFVIGAAVAAVRRRRQDLAVLATFGWGPGQLTAAVGGELAAVAVLAAAVGETAAVLLHGAAGVAVGVGWIVLSMVAVPFTVTSVAAVVAAATGRSQAARTLARRTRRGGRAASLVRLGIAGATERRGQLAVAASAVAAGIGAFSVLRAIDVEFGSRATATRTILGTRIDLQVHSLDVLAAVLLLVLGAATVLTVTLAGLRERLRSQAVLTATGWEPRHLMALILAEALAVVAAGATAGAFGPLLAVFSFGTGVPDALIPYFSAIAGTGAIVVVFVAVPVRRCLRHEQPARIPGL